MKFRNLRVLVTGGADFVGTHLIDGLLKRGNRVIVYNNFNLFYKDK